VVVKAIVYGAGAENRITLAVVIQNVFSHMVPYSFKEKCPALGGKGRGVFVSLDTCQNGLFNPSDLCLDS
jgi:hypothetical protein